MGASHGTTYSSFVGVGAELSIDVLIERFVELSSQRCQLGIVQRDQRVTDLFLLLIEVITSNIDDPRRQTHIVRSLNLRPSQHHSLQQRRELLERLGSFPSRRSAVLNRFEDLVVPVADVLHSRMLTLLAGSLDGEPVERLAVALLAEVEGERVDSNESNERVQLSYSILQRSTCSAGQHRHGNDG